MTKPKRKRVDTVLAPVHYRDEPWMHRVLATAFMSGAGATAAAALRDLRMQCARAIEEGEKP